MKTPKIFTKQQYRKWQLEKRMKKRSNRIIAGLIIIGATLIFLAFRQAWIKKTRLKSGEYLVIAKSKIRS